MIPPYDQIQEAAGFLRDRGAVPKTLVILGTGLGGFADHFDDPTEIPYEAIPHLAKPTSPGHLGAMILAGDVMVMAGRAHYYEGFSMREITLPIRVAAVATPACRRRSRRPQSI